MSASKLRAAVAANDFKLFKTGMPTGFSGARELFDAIAKGLAKPMKKSKKTINEKAPPDEKAERMISKAKDSFQDRYGDNADSYLYGVAWKQYNKRHGIKTKTRLGEPIMEGAVNEEIEQIDELSPALLGRYIKKAGYSASDAANRAGQMRGAGNGKKSAAENDLYKKVIKREKGIGKAVDRLLSPVIEEEIELDEASNTIPNRAKIVTQNLQKKTITYTWYDWDTEKWIEREVPQDEAPGFYARAGTAMKTRKTDKFGNLIKAPVKPKVNMDDVMAANMKTAKELIDLINGKPVGAVVTFYGKKPNKADEYEMNIVRMMYQGDMIYTVKSSGRFVELRPTASGLQIVDTKTHRILLDKGNDAIW